jgi:hypothetical protein
MAIHMTKAKGMAKLVTKKSLKIDMTKLVSSLKGHRLAEGRTCFFVSIVT